MNKGKIIWKDEMTVFSRRIDEQHKRLLNLVNSLENNNDSMSNKEYARLLSLLTDYLIEHFEIETAYLEEIGYPDLGEHMAEHRRFIQVISNYNLDYYRSSVVDVEKVYKFLKSWLINHELGADMAYRDYLINQVKGGHKS